MLRCIRLLTPTGCDFFPAYNRKLAGEMVASYMFNLIISLEIVLIGFLVNTNAQCLETTFTCVQTPFPFSSRR
jgi:hypothetical protein